MNSILLSLILATSSAPTGAAATSTPRVSIMVKPDSEVANANVAIKDIGTVQCADTALAAKIETSVVCSAPLAGKSIMISREQITIALRRQGLDDRLTDLLSPTLVKVTRASSSVSGQALYETARQYVLTTGSLPDAIVEPVRLPEDQVVPAGKLELRVREVGWKLHRGRNSVPVEIIVDGRVCATVHITIQVRVFAKALVSTQAIARTEELTAINTTTETREITNLPDDVALPSGANVIAAVPIPEGTIIRRSMISDPPVVRSGDSVTVVVEGAYVRVSDKGVAAQDGRCGDRIKVRLTGQVREIRGTVAGPGIVKIDMDRRN